MRMVSDDFRRRKEGLFRLLKTRGALDPEAEQGFVELYGGRGKRALEAVKSDRVIKKGRRWFVRGKADEYEVFRETCTCRDHVLNIVTEKVEADMCYHSLAKNICETLNSHYVDGRGS